MDLYYQKELDKMTQDKRNTFFIGKYIFKQILLKSTMMIADLMGISDIVIEKVTITDADLAYNLDYLSSNDRVPWQVNQATNILASHKVDDIAILDSYSIRYDYYENYRQCSEILSLTPSHEEFYETIMIGLIHELRHVMQIENLVDGRRDTISILVDMTEEENKNLNFKAFSKKNAELLESDAVSFADEFYSTHFEKINRICQKEMQTMLDRIAVGWYNPSDFYKYRELI